VILLDTHAAVWLATDEPVLGQKSSSIALAARAENQLAIQRHQFPGKLLVAKDRLEMHRQPAKLRADLLDAGVIDSECPGDFVGIRTEDARHAIPIKLRRQYWRTNRSIASRYFG
jgi:hypothetical protein